MELKKTSKIFWITLAVLLLALAFLPRPPKTDVERPAPDSVPSVSTVKIDEVRQNPAYEVDIEYPELKLPGREEAAQKINSDIKSRVDKTARDFGSDPLFLRGSSISTIRGRYEMGYLNRNIFSYVMYYSAEYSGAAHPDNYSETYTFDLRNGNLAALGDLFKVGSNYLPTIADYSRATLIRQMPEGRSQIEEGTVPGVENYRNFIISQEGLVIIFNPYQVASGAAGFQRVVIPYAALDRFINEASLLGLRGG